MLDEKISAAIALLQEHEPPEGYWVGFSGGKDSLVCYHLCKLANVKAEFHYNMTTVDPPR